MLLQWFYFIIIIIIFLALGENGSDTHEITIYKCLNNIIHMLRLGAKAVF